MNDSYVYATVRTPFGKFGGALAGVRPDDLASVVISGALAKAPALDHQLIGEVIRGCANQAGECNELLAEKTGISRERQDEFAVGSNDLADQPWDEGFYDDLVTTGLAGIDWGVAAICVGVGQGLAVVLEKVTAKGTRS